MLDRGILLQVLPDDIDELVDAVIKFSSKDNASGEGKCMCIWKVVFKLWSVFWISLHQNHMKSDASQYDAFNSSASRMPPAKCLKNLISPTSNLFPTKILLICFCLPCNNNNNHCNLWFFNMLTSISTTTGFFLWFWLQNLLCGWNILKFNQVPNFLYFISIL